MTKKRRKTKPEPEILGTYTTDIDHPQTGTLLVAATAANDAFERAIGELPGTCMLGLLRDARNATKAVLASHKSGAT